MDKTAGEALEFIDQHETVRRLVRLIDEAPRRATLVSPYIGIEKLRNLTRAIHAACKRGVTVSLVVRAPDKSTKHKEPCIDELRGLVDAGLKLYALRDLHAKIYASDSNAIVTSLNLLDSSFNNSIEIGMWVPASRPEFAQIRKFFVQHIQQHWAAVKPDDLLARPPDDDEREDARSPRRSAPRPSRAKKDRGEETSDVGHCIKCWSPIPLDPLRPYCKDDFADAAPDDVEEFCHACGNDYPATRHKPLCRRCFREWDEPPPPGDEDAPF